MKYIHDAAYPTLELSRRNLEALLAKLDDPASACTLVSPGRPDEPFIVVRAVENDEHYATRAAGEVFMPSSGVIWPQPDDVRRDVKA